MNGRCVLTSDKVRVDGQCANDNFNGPGKAVFEGGDRYEGDFKDSTLTGTGIWYFKNGPRWEGQFLDAKFNGKGRAIYASGENGRGVLHGVTHGLLGEGRHDYIGTWMNGCFHQEPYTAELFKTRAECGF